jgi:hypothetical protein
MGLAFALPLAVVACLFLNPLTHAQNSVMAPPLPRTEPDIQRKSEPARGSVPPEPLENPFVYGSISFHPNIYYRFLHAEGLQAAPGESTTSDINVITTGLSVDMGEHWTLNYSPTWIKYSADNFDDTFDQYASLQGITTFVDWGFQVSEEFTLSSPILVETGEQTRQQTWATTLGASRNIGSKWQLQFTGGMTDRSGDISNDMRDWSTMEWVSYRQSSQFQFGLGLGLGYTEITDSPDVTYEIIMGRFVWQPTERFSLLMNAGYDFRHSNASGASDMTTPLLGATLQYHPFDQTSVSVSVSQTVDNSFFEADVTKNTGWSANLSQRLFGHFYLSLDASLQDIEYTSVSDLSAPVDRSDRLETIGARLTVQLRTRWNIAVVYQHMKNTSNVGDFGFSTEQAGVELSWRF